MPANRKTRAQGLVDVRGAATLEPDEFWLTPQVGTKKNPAKATHLFVTAAHSFVTVRGIPKEKYWTLPVPDHSTFRPEPESEPESEPRLSKIVLLKTSPEKLKKVVEAIQGREASVADSGVDLKTPGPSVATPRPEPVEAHRIPEEAEGGETVKGATAEAYDQAEDAASEPEQAPTPTIGSPLLEPAQFAEETEPNNFIEPSKTESEVVTEPNEAPRQTNDEASPPTPTAHSAEPLSQAFAGLGPQPESLSLEPSPKTLPAQLPRLEPLATAQSEEEFTDQLVKTNLPAEDSTPANDSQPLISNAGALFSEATSLPPSPPKKSSPGKRKRTATPSPKSSPKRKGGRPKKQGQAAAQASTSGVSQVYEPRLRGESEPVPAGPACAFLSLKVNYDPSQRYTMAPVRDPNDVATAIQNAVQTLFDIQQTTAAFVAESQDVLIDRVDQLATQLQHLEHITNKNKNPDNPIQHMKIAPEIIDYVDDGRNPDVFTREFVELVQRGNAVMNGKQKAFGDFARILGQKMKEGMPGVGRQVDEVLRNGGLEPLLDREDGKEGELPNGAATG